MTDRRDYLGFWDGSALVPVNASEHERLDERLGQGEVVTFKFTKRRSNVQLDYYWAKLKELLDSGAVPKYHDTDDLHTVIKMEMGFVTPVLNMRGQIEFHPKSIAMDRLDQDAMNQFMERAWQLIAEHWGIDMEAIGDARLPAQAKTLEPAPAAGDP
jgi:hypothetical protein